MIAIAPKIKDSAISDVLGGNRASGTYLTDTEGLVTNFPWLIYHEKKPVEKEMSLFEMEGLVARRMEMLARIDQQINAPRGPGEGGILKWIADKVADEVNLRWSDATKKGTKRNVPEDAFCFTAEEEIISHCLCRYAFCMEEKWRKWFIKYEELLFRARLERLLGVIGENDMIRLIFKACSLPCDDVPEGNPIVRRALNFINKKRSGPDAHSEADLCLVPLQYVLKLVMDRQVVCLNGYAIILKKDAKEVLSTMYVNALRRNLRKCQLKREELFGDEYSDERKNVYAMADAFLQHFVADPNDQLAQAPTGSVAPKEIQALAKAHMPLCMRRIDQHLRREGHVKHNGRWQYGLFLKSIGLSMEDAVTFFSDVMTLKGGGSKEAYAKSAYGYNIRHMYGQEGKRTSYSSQSCVTIINGAPQLDKHDCHGCPFRFSDEATLRHMLAEERPNPFTQASQCLAPSEIEDIVQDAKNSHYTRACYKHFMGSRKGALRDSLFRSPFEYYTVSVEAEREAKAQREGKSGATISAVDGSSPAGGRRTRVDAGGDATPGALEDAPSAKKQRGE